LEGKWGERRKDFGEEAETSKKEAPLPLHRSRRGPCPPEGEKGATTIPRGKRGGNPESLPNSSTSMRGGKLETQGEQGSRIPTTLLAASRIPKLPRGPRVLGGKPRPRRCGKDLPLWRWCSSSRRDWKSSPRPHPTRFHLAQKIQGACPEPHARGKLWEVIKEGSWDNVEAFFRKRLSQKECSRERRKLKDLCRYLSGNSRRNPECQALPGCSHC